MSELGQRDGTDLSELGQREGTDKPGPSPKGEPVRPPDKAKRLRSVLGKLAARAAETLYPTGLSCIKCGRDVFSGEVLCPVCESGLTRNDKLFCPQCGMPTAGEAAYCIRCVDQTRYYESARSVFVYDREFKSILRRFKEQGERWMAGGLAELLWDNMREYRIGAEVLTSVPVTARRLRKRGYNQAEELARALSVRSGIPYRPMLEKVRETTEQKSLGYEDRQANLRGAFALLRGIRSESRRVLLIDDVITTTATVNECCRILSSVCENGVKVLSICTAIRKIGTE